MNNCNTSCGANINFCDTFGTTFTAKKIDFSVDITNDNFEYQILDEYGNVKFKRKIGSGLFIQSQSLIIEGVEIPIREYNHKLFWTKDEQKYLVFEGKYTVSRHQCCNFDITPFSLVGFNINVSQVIYAPDINNSIRFEDLTPEQLAILKEPSIEAAELANTATDNANTATAQLTGKISEVDTLINDVEVGEVTRQNNEQVRQNAETDRQDAESGRISGENRRINTETARQTKENNRVTSEMQRINAENSRISQESIRANTESQRVTNEAKRQNNEATWINQEYTRQTNEAVRIANDSARESVLSSKITKPTIDITNPDAVYKFLPLLDASGNAKRIDASNLGKNIGNSDLTLTSARTLDTAGKVFSITNLPNKSADASFNKMKVQNASGQEAVSNGKELFKGIPAILDDTEKANFRTAMNGGWTTYTMSISNVFPRLIKNEDNPFWIDVMGSNLNLNPATMVVKVVNLLDNSETIINNNKVTLVAPNLIMVEINPSLFAQGSYKIKLHNGIADVLSGQSFRIAASVENIDINAITWEKLAYTSGKENAIFPTASGGSVSYVSDATNRGYDSTGIIVGAVKSSKLFNAGEKFVIKGNIEVNIMGNATIDAGIICGMMNNNLSNSLNIITECYLRGASRWMYPTTMNDYYIGNGLDSIPIIKSGYSISLFYSIVKEGNQMMTVIRYGTKILVNNIIISDADFAMQIILLNSSMQIYNNINITEAYTF